MVEQFTAPLQTQKTHIEEARIVIDIEHKKIAIEAKIGNLDAGGNLIDAEYIRVMHRDDEFQPALKFLLPDGIGLIVRTNARKLIKRCLEQQHGLTEDTL